VRGCVAPPHPSGRAAAPRRGTRGVGRTRARSAGAPSTGPREAVRGRPTALPVFAGGSNRGARGFATGPRPGLWEVSAPARTSRTGVIGRGWDARPARSAGAPPTEPRPRRGVGAPRRTRTPHPAGEVSAPPGPGARRRTRTPHPAGRGQRTTRPLRPAANPHSAPGGRGQRTTRPLRPAANPHSPAPRQKPCRAPPSTGSITPVKYDAAGDSRNAAALPNSSGAP
jgi:hypothetical protein